MELILTLPMEMRRSGTLQVDIIAREWPELLRYPLSTPSIPRRVWLRAKRTLWPTRRAKRADFRIRAATTRSDATSAQQSSEAHDETER